MKTFINLLKNAQLLREINEPLDCELEIAHLAYVEAKKPQPKALLFTRPVRGGRELGVPVLANLFASEAVLNMVLKAPANAVAARIDELLHTHVPAKFGEKLSLLSRLVGLKNIAPVRKINPKAPCKEREYSMSELPILRTWEHDAGEFITMGQLYTRSLDGKQNNLGMYRLQVIAAQQAEQNCAQKFDLIAHFQLHKDANNFFYEYKKAGKLMPVAVAIGAHPLHILCAQAPLPKGIFELVLAGFISGKGAELVRCDTNDLYVPAGSDFVIEGFIDPAAPLEVEGPFGDHTGFYTPQGLFPRIKVSKITGKADGIFSATVVGKPPLEDRWMGYATERIFAPLLRTSVPAVIDYHLPEAGAFHNLCVVKIRADFPGAAQAVAHAFWGLGQMAFCKNLIIVGEDAPALNDYAALAEHVLANLRFSGLMLSQGMCDELDHASEKICLGGKLLVDITRANYEPATARNGLNCARPSGGQMAVTGKKSSDALGEQAGKQKRELNLLALQNVLQTNDLSVFFKDSPMPIICAHLGEKPGDINAIYERVKDYLVGILVIFNDAKSHTPYMLLFRALANFDAARDIKIGANGVLIDATAKGKIDGYLAPWPQEVECKKDVIKKLIEKNLLEFDEILFKNFEILSDMDIQNLKNELKTN